MNIKRDYTGHFGANELAAQGAARVAGNLDAYTHARGESVYLDDIPELSGTLYAAVFGSPLAHGTITRLDLSEAEKSAGVVRIFTYEDIPGENQIGGIVPDEPLLAECEVHYCGMPVALVVAKSVEQAQAALKKISVSIDPLPVITNPREAKEKGNLIVQPRTFSLGDTENAWSKCEYIFEGTAETNGQEHLYIETQGAYAVPSERNRIRIYSSTQGPTAVQRHTAAVLNMSMNEIEVDVTRLGGGFGGKEDQATPWAALCALAVYHLRKPVKYVLHRLEDMKMTGKRNPYTSDFKIGLSKDLKIIAYEASFYQNAGASADLSPAVLERTLFHCTNSYYVPHVKATAYSCKTNLPSNTAFRGFGGPQGMFVMEAAIAKAAAEIGVDREEIQKRNLIDTGEEFPYGQKAESEASACWTRAEELYDFSRMKQDVEDFNVSNIRYKKGLAMMPICFGISFTKTFMNQGRALVHVYSDGSVGLSTGAVEMGQGVNTKMVQVAANVFSIDPMIVRIETTNTLRIANTSPSAASATADLNGKAVEMSCQAILERLISRASEILGTDAKNLRIEDGWVWNNSFKTDLSWEKLVFESFIKRVGLSEHAHYATPDIYFDPSTEKGHPFAYHVYGTAIITTTVDCIRGTYQFDSVKIVHDFGKSVNPLLDRGQIEGGLVQGLGWMTMEEIFYDEKGNLKSNALSTYKVPDIYSVPGSIEIHHLETEKPNKAVFQSKAVGEPPLMYALGAIFALQNAIRAFNPKAVLPYSAPLTPEKVLLSLYSNQQRKPEHEKAAFSMAAHKG